MIEHLLLDIDDVQSAVRAKPPGDVQGLQAGPGPDLKDALTRPGVEQRVKTPVGQERNLAVKHPAVRVGVRRRLVPPPGGHGPGNCGAGSCRSHARG